MHDWSPPVILLGEDTLLARESGGHELAGILHVQGHDRPLQHDREADRLPLHVLLLQQPEVVDLGELHRSRRGRLLRDGDRLHLCHLLPARLSAAGMLSVLTTASSSINRFLYNQGEESEGLCCLDDDAVVSVASGCPDPVLE